MSAAQPEPSAESAPPSEPSSRRGQFFGWARRRWIYLALFVVGLIIYGGTAAGRLRRQSTDPHFMYQATAWLHGKIAIDPPPARGDDWAKVETVLLKDGRTVRGRRLATRRTFAIAGGVEVPIAAIARTVKTTHYVSFPPFPAVLMLPQAAMDGRIANDVATTVVIAALILPLAFSVLTRLRDAGLSERTDGDNLWLTAALGFGSVLFFSSVQGRVWFTAHVVGVALALAYLRCAIGARFPALAGLCLGLATMTRTPMAFMFPLFLFEAWRSAGGRKNLRAVITCCLRFAAPVVCVAIVAAIYNHVRFDDVLEFGHSYLDVRQQRRMETTGMFSLDYLSRNLAVALALLPDLSVKSPHVLISGHGLALWFTSPYLLYLLWPRERGPIFWPLVITAALVALPTLLYQNSGWVQFGYRFSLDYMVFLIALWAVGKRPLTHLAKALIVCAVVVNLFGAVTFARANQFYKTDATTYRTVIAH